MNKYKLIVAIILSTILTSCMSEEAKGGINEVEEYVKTVKFRNKKVFQNSSYHKDKRTGLCFLVITADLYFKEGAAIANVPCDKVPESLLK